MSPQEMNHSELAKRLDLPYQNWMQDWPIEIADSEKLPDYLSKYKGLKNEEEKRTLMLVILQAAEETSDLENFWTEINNLLTRDYEIHKDAIRFWSAEDATNEEEKWRITQHIRLIGTDR